MATRTDAQALDLIANIWKVQAQEGSALSDLGYTWIAEVLASTGRDPGDWPDVG